MLSATQLPYTGEHICGVSSDIADTLVTPSDLKHLDQTWMAVLESLVTSPGG